MQTGCPGASRAALRRPALRSCGAGWPARSVRRWWPGCGWSPPRQQFFLLPLQAHAQLAHFAGQQRHREQRRRWPARSAPLRLQADSAAGRGRPSRPWWRPVRQWRSRTAPGSRAGAARRCRTRSPPAAPSARRRAAGRPARRRRRCSRWRPAACSTASCHGRMRSSLAGADQHIADRACRTCRTQISEGAGVAIDDAGLDLDEHQQHAHGVEHAGGGPVAAACGAAAGRSRRTGG